MQPYLGQEGDGFNYELCFLFITFFRLIIWLWFLDALSKTCSAFLGVKRFENCQNAYKTLKRTFIKKINIA